jgi:hypothetical protein
VLNLNAAIHLNSEETGTLVLLGEVSLAIRILPAQTRTSLTPVRPTRSP